MKMRGLFVKGTFFLSTIIAIGLTGCQTTQNGQTGLKSEVQPDAAIRLRQDLCARGVVEACLELAKIYLKEGITAQTIRKIDWALISACNTRSGIGCYRAAVLMEKHSTEFFEKKLGGPSVVNITSGWFIAAQKYYDEECNAGNNLSCFNSAFMSYKGEKVSKNIKAAIASYEKACDGNLLGACTNLASIYMDEKQGLSDTDRAITLFQKACDGGEYIACTKLGVVYSNGFGVDPDPDASLRYFDKACRLKPSTEFCQKILREKTSS